MSVRSPLYVPNCVANFSIVSLFKPALYALVFASVPDGRISTYLSVNSRYVPSPTNLTSVSSLKSSSGKTWAKISFMFSRVINQSLFASAKVK